ncbi:class F sortase [Streptomyces uncialis]|uniref:class F sortase n=1 Tax=Streptomyces uncialis TaxID=1048205 RepID=UPI00382503D6
MDRYVGGVGGSGRAGVTTGADGAEQGRDEGEALRAALAAHERASRAETGRRLRVGWSSMALAVLVGIRLVQGEPPAEPPRPTPAAAVRAAPSGPAAQSAHAPLAVSRPARVLVPAVGVDAPLQDIGYDPRGQIAAPPPDRPDLAGWFAQGPAPGERGTAVITGHVDTRTGPAVFYPLGALDKGATVEVPRADGRTALFTVYGIEVLKRDGFPSERVYGDLGRAELRLITCGGTYTGEAGYDANVVVFATLSGVR